MQRKVWEVWTPRRRHIRCCL